MQIKGRYSVFPAAIAAIALAGCAELEQALSREAVVVVATKVFIGPESTINCNALATGVSWKLTQISGLTAAADKTVALQKTLGFQGAFSDGDPPVAQPNWCVFRGMTKVPPGTYAVEAKLTFQGTPWTSSCSVAVFEDFEPCEAPDWVGFSAAGSGPAGPGCAIVTSVVENPQCTIGDGFAAFPTPGS